MTADLTREQAREQVARAIRPRAWVAGGVGRGLGESYEDAEHRHQDYARQDADRALTVLWPVVERLTRERDDYYDEACEQRMRAIHAEGEVERLTAELAHAHTVIARHVEPRREGEP